MFEYKATILRVVDGDTVHADVDLGFDSHQRMTLRLAGIDAPELSTPEGKAAAAYLRQLIYGGLADYAHEPNLITANLTVRTVKDRREKFGRYLATLYSVGGVDLNEAMIAAGHARPYDGGKR